MRVCLFCDATHLSREHTFPDWILRLYPKKTKWSNGRMADSSGRRIELHSPEHKARLVCRECNGGWMSDLENHVKYTLIDFMQRPHLPRLVTLTERRSLAAWITLRAMMVDGITLKPRKVPYFTIEQRRGFRELCRTPRLAEPPAETVVWMAHSETDRIGFSSFFAHEQTPDLPGRYATTFHVGKAVIQLFNWRHSPIDGPPLIPEALREWEAGSIQIWPRKGSRSEWPPLLPLSQLGERRFANRFTPHENRIE